MSLAEVYKRDKNLLTARLRVWFGDKQQFVQVAKELIVNLQHPFLLQVSILDPGLCTGGASLCSPWPTLWRGWEQAAQPGMTSPQPLRSARVDRGLSSACEPWAGFANKGGWGGAAGSGLLKQRRRKWKRQRQASFFSAWTTSSKAPFTLSYSMLIRVWLSLPRCTKWGSVGTQLKHARKKMKRKEGWSSLWRVNFRFGAENCQQRHALFLCTCKSTIEGTAAELKGKKRHSKRNTNSRCKDRTVGWGKEKGSLR